MCEATRGPQTPRVTRALGVLPRRPRNAVVFNRALSASCRSGRPWRQAIRLLEQAEESGKGVRGRRGEGGPWEGDDLGRSVGDETVMRR